jgi:hypothetical protein
VVGFCDVRKRRLNHHLGDCELSGSKSSSSEPCEKLENRIGYIEKAKVNASATSNCSKLNFLRMLKNYFNIVFRNLESDKSETFIDVPDCHLKTYRTNLQIAFFPVI